ncbi:MAG: ATP-binding cassette domain-containing protein [Lachnospiraceae bacterium]|nr:ATP-binding cassette domain-containing protein [Lachnospiraceae bacterium]
MYFQLKQLSMTYPSGKEALKDVTLELKSPNLIGLLGPNGAGKSTLMQLLVAGILPTKGEILLNNVPLMQAEHLLKSKLGYLPQTFGLYDELTIYQFLDYIAALKQIPNRKQAIDSVLSDTNLKDKKKIKIRTLSGGQRQRVGIAQALLGNPQFLIFDEPTVGLDPEERIAFRNLFSRMAQERLVLLSTHIIEDVQSVCNQLIVIHHGNILFVGTPVELICQAEGHVGIFEETNIGQESGISITSRVNTSRGIICRAVADKLPVFASFAEPTLEDAYLYLISKEDAK